MFCDNVFQLLINQQIPIDIKVRFRGIKQDAIYKCNQANSIYLSYFDSQTLLKKYKQPKCNTMFYIPHVKPHISLKIHEEWSRHRNGCILNVLQFQCRNVDFLFVDKL